MKYRIQMDAIFSNANANSILDHMESIKSLPHASTGFEHVSTVRKSSKCNIDNIDNPLVEYDTVDFDTAQTTHTTSHSGTEFHVSLDVSFSVQQDYLNLLNYIESIKSLSISTTGYIRVCRFFICNHDENPLINDGSYNYIDFDGAVQSH